MADLYKNRYRILSARLQSWNYANAAMYFVTICTKKRTWYFGEVAKAQMQLTEIGVFAHDAWMQTLELRPDMNVELGEYVIMPNHVHGIVIIGANEYNDTDARMGTQCGAGTGTQGNAGMGRKRDARQCVSTSGVNERCNAFAPQSKNLASIVRGYKTSVATYATKNNIPFAWQPRYHDHIIRSTEEYYRIANYIANNPARWHKDRLCT